MDSKNIDREELKSYLKGKLSDSHNHEFEKKALASAFDTEAVEGLESVSEEAFAQSMGNLDKRLSERTAQKKKGVNWYLISGVAASILLVLTTVFYVQNGNTGRNQIVKADSITERNETKVNGQNLALEYSKEKQEPELEETPEVEIPEEDITAESSGKTDFTASSSTQSVEKKEVPETEIVREEENAISLNIAEEEIYSETETDDMVFEEEIVLESADVLAAEPQAQPSQLKVVEPASGASSAYSRTRSKKLESKANESSIFGNREPSPINGFDALKEYISENKKAKKAEAGDYAIISFDVKDDSKLSNFKILEETKEDLGKEAIRLIKKGPNWFPAIEEGVAVKKEVELKVDF